MVRWKRIALGLLVAYAASMTLWASRMTTEVFLYRCIMEQSHQSEHPSLSASYYLMGIAKDNGTDLASSEFWALRLAYIQGLLLVPLVNLSFLLGLGAALLRFPSRSKLDKD